MNVSAAQLGFIVKLKGFLPVLHAIQVSPVVWGHNLALNAPQGNSMMLLDQPAKIVRLESMASRKGQRFQAHVKIVELENLLTARGKRRTMIA